MLASPDGVVIDQGLIVHDDEKVSATGSFHSANGSAGLILDIVSIGENGIDSQIKPEALQLGSAEVRPLVFSERRLYVVGGAQTGAQLPAFERQLMWLGLENVDQSIMLSGESTRLMGEVEGEYRGGDSAVSLAVGGDYSTAVAPSGGGHAVLVTNSLRDAEFPPTHGLWLQEFVAGEPRRDTYLNPDAEHLGSLFKMLASDGDGNLYVASPNFVMRLNAAGELVAYAESAATTANVKAMVVDGDSSWLFGEYNISGEGQQQMWVERIQF
jgi:hypothetical protein